MKVFNQAEKKLFFYFNGFEVLCVQTQIKKNFESAALQRFQSFS
jgi:hypothetical protein